MHPARQSGTIRVYAAFGPPDCAVRFILQADVAPENPGAYWSPGLLGGEEHAAVNDPNRSRGPAPVPANVLLAHLQQRAEEERQRLARMLHHDVSGMLAAARMDLSRLIAREAADGDAAEQLRRVDQLLAQVIGDARAEMKRLRPALIDHFGLPV